MVSQLTLQKYVTDLYFQCHISQCPTGTLKNITKFRDVYEQFGLLWNTSQDECVNKNTRDNLRYDYVNVSWFHMLGERERERKKMTHWCSILNLLRDCIM